MTKEQTEITLFKDSDWSLIDGELCRVINFSPWAKISNGAVVDQIDKTEPYTSVHIECKKLQGIATGLITHKVDFIHLWLAFNERTIKGDEEVLIIWTKQHYKPRLFKAISSTLPKLWVMVCPKGAYELMSDPKHRPELSGEARWHAMAPIDEWKPDAME
ncbi:MAG: hypothetical protein IBX64_06940 [Actinobacteria bacterium]|nr:hypothetical protein [Actinomycetota bacterium]